MEIADLIAGILIMLLPPFLESAFITLALYHAKRETGKAYAKGIAAVMVVTLLSHWVLGVILQAPELYYLIGFMLVCLALKISGYKVQFFDFIAVIILMGIILLVQIITLPFYFIDPLLGYTIYISLMCYVVVPHASMSKKKYESLATRFNESLNLRGVLLTIYLIVLSGYVVLFKF